MIEQLIKQEKELLTALEENRLKQRVYNTEKFCEKHGIKIGDTIKFQDGRETFVGVLSKFEYSRTDVMWPIVLLLNKDGQIGKREKKVWTHSLETVEVLKRA